MGVLALAEFAAPRANVILSTTAKLFFSSLLSLIGTLFVYYDLKRNHKAINQTPTYRNYLKFTVEKNKSQIEEKLKMFDTYYEIKNSGQNYFIRYRDLKMSDNGLYEVIIPSAKVLLERIDDKTTLIHLKLTGLAIMDFTGGLFSLKKEIIGILSSSKDN